MKIEGFLNLQLGMSLRWSDAAYPLVVRAFANTLSRAKKKKKKKKKKKSMWGSPTTPLNMGPHVFFGPNLEHFYFIKY